MCGIIGAIAERDVEAILLSGLQQLEYRGYDSAGMAVIDAHQHIDRRRTEGKVDNLALLLKSQPLRGKLGIAHTRWATHGKPTENNAHPHMSHDEIALVHNGIIENHEKIRQKLIAKGYVFQSETDSEVAVHLIHFHFKATKDLLRAVQLAASELIGAFSLGIICTLYPDRLLGVRRGAPLVVGVGIGEHFIASDALALSLITQRVCYLEEGDVVDVYRDHFAVVDAQGQSVTRVVQEADRQHQATGLGGYRHYMQKEIFEQVNAVMMTLDGRLNGEVVLESVMGQRALDVFKKIEHVQIVACGTSYHAGLVARQWLESMANINCQVEVASEFRYRKHVVLKNTLLVLISQSGETADLLSALRDNKQSGFLASLAICNVPMSTLSREADMTLMTKAGAEIGVASTKAFSAQLTALALLTTVLARKASCDEKKIVQELKCLPSDIERILLLDAAMKKLAEQFRDKQHALFLGRGLLYPIALEGALKLKEISYIHAEAYPAGELKHGPLALVDTQMPVIACAPQNSVFEKIASNLQEVKSRGGELIVFSDSDTFAHETGMQWIAMPTVADWLTPIIYTIPLQLLAYHVAVLKGTDVDKPRNLAKSVTVE